VTTSKKEPVHQARDGQRTAPGIEQAIDRMPPSQRRMTKNINETGLNMSIIVR
jgi:hypothetical protein